MTAINVIILPGTDHPDSPSIVDIALLENRLQVNIDGRSDYTLMNRALTFRSNVNSGIPLKEMLRDDAAYADLSEKDFKNIHRELHDRLVINQERPFTTIPEAMKEVDDWKSKEDITEKELEILDEYDTYLKFMENYFSSKDAKPLKKGSELAKQIFS